jgi:vacuolar protein sorting-associated protein 26
VRVTVSRRMSDVVQEKELWVYSYRMPPEINDAIKMEVGIEDCLHIEFEYTKAKCDMHSWSSRCSSKRRYSLKDVIVGRIYFLLVRIKVKHMELAIIRRETTGAGALIKCNGCDEVAPNQYHDNETLAKFEIMDGAPVRGIFMGVLDC